MNMRTITFTGGSDDLVNITGAPGCDEVDPQALDGEWNVLRFQHTASPYSGTFDIVASSGRMRVHALYDGTWSFAVSIADKTQPLPDWPVTVTPSETTAYSVQLTVQAPDDAVIICPDET